MYFNEACCPGRHFKIEIQGDVLDEDVSYRDYDPTPGIGRHGRLSFTVSEKVRLLKTLSKAKAKALRSGSADDYETFRTLKGISGDLVQLL